MDWYSPDIKNSFEYELVDPFDLTLSLGWLDNVESCTVTEFYKGEYRACARLSLDGGQLPIGALVRVWHIAEQNGEVYRHALGTFMQTLEPDMAYEFGRYYGDVPLQSTLYRLGTDKRAGFYSVMQGTSIVEHFETVIRNSGSTPLVSAALDRSMGFSKSHIWVPPESVLTEARRCADALNARIDVDELGRVILEPNAPIDGRAVSHAIPAGDSSPVFVGLGVRNPQVVNKVVAYYSAGERTYSVSQQVDATHPWHFRKIGRHAVLECSESDLGEELTDTQIYTELTKRAKARLKDATAAKAEWSATVLYAPIKCGSVIELPYSDSPDGELLIKGVLMEREIVCDRNMNTNITIQEV